MLPSSFSACSALLNILVVNVSRSDTEFSCVNEKGGEVNWLFNVTINDISVIYVKAHRCAGGLKKLDLRWGSKRHRHFVRFFNVPILAPTREHPFYTVIPTHRPIKSPFTITLGIRRTHSRLNPWVDFSRVFVTYQPQQLNEAYISLITVKLTPKI